MLLNMNLQSIYKKLIFKNKNLLFCSTSILQVVVQVVLLLRVAAD